MAKGTWADGAGLAWSEPAGVHWIQDWTLAAPVTVAALPAATINWKNYTNTTPVANTVLYNANINLRWRVEPPPLGPLAVTAQATINWKHIVNTAALALSAEPLATINWRNITNTSALALTTTPDAVAIAVKTSVTAVRLDLLTVIRREKCSQ